MKVLIKVIFSASFGISLVVLAFVFSMWSADFATWSVESRTGLAFLSSFGAFFGVAIGAACGLYD